MRGIDIYGDDIAVIDDVNNYSECYEHCNERPDCRIWTYVEGSCYMKSENTFKADVNSSVVVGGIKDCLNGKKGYSLQNHNHIHYIVLHYTKLPYYSFCNIYRMYICWTRSLRRRHQMCIRI